MCIRDRPYIRLVLCMAVSFLPLVIYLGVMDWDMDSPLIWLFIACLLYTSRCV